MEKKNTLGVVLIGVFAALVFAASWLQINIPTPIDNTRIHLGNVLCLLSGFMLGAWRGGLAAGIGSMLFDFTNPLYLPSAPFTFAFKFIMGFVCGLIGSRVRERHNTAFKIVAATAGQLTYIVLYLSKGYFWDAIFIKGVPAHTAWADVVLTKAPVSLFNGLISVLIAVPLALALQKTLVKTSLYRRFAPAQKD